MKRLALVVLLAGCGAPETRPPLIGETMGDCRAVAEGALACSGDGGDVLFCPLARWLPLLDCRGKQPCHSGGDAGVTCD